MRSILSKFALLLVLAIASAAQQLNLDTQLKGSRWPAFGTDSGAADAYVVTTIAPLGPGLRTGSKFIFFAAHSNTGASTLNVDSSGIKTIKKWSGGSQVDLASGDITAGRPVEVIYDGSTYYNLIGAGITSLTCGTGMSGGTITTSGTCAISMVPLANGGTNADLSGSGGAVNTTGKYVCKMDAAHVFTCAALIAADLPNTAVTAASYTHSNLTIDEQGRITSASSGTRTCQPGGFGDGLSATTAGTYVMYGCYNDSGATWVIQGIRCFEDGGSSTLQVDDNSANHETSDGGHNYFTCSNSWAAGTQNGTQWATGIPNGGWLKFTYVADGTTKTSSFEVLVQ